MTSNLQNLTYNQSIPYKDGFARVISQSLNNTVWIEFNGQRLLVNKNDLFGVNEQKERVIESFQSQIDNANKDYEYYSARLDEAQTNHKIGLENQNFFKREMNKLLSKFTKREDLSSAQEKEYQILEDKFISSRRLTWRAGSDVMTYSIWAADAVYHRHDIECQQMIAEAILG